MSKEYTYDIEKYTIGVDENGEDGIGLTVAMVENNEIKFLGNCYGDNARCIDLLNSYSRNETQPKLVRFGNNIFECNVNSVIWQIIERYKGNIIFLLNFEVEIIEEDKKIEKINVSKKRTNFYCTPIEMEIMCKLNEVVDVINKLKVDD